MRRDGSLRVMRATLPATLGVSVSGTGKSLVWTALKRGQELPGRQGNSPKVPNSPISQLLGIPFSSVYSAPAVGGIVFVRVFGARWGEDENGGCRQVVQINHRPLGTRFFKFMASFNPPSDPKE